MLETGYPRWGEDCVWEEDQGVAIVFKIAQGTPDEQQAQAPETLQDNAPILLNREGSDTWRECDGTRTIDEITSLLMKKYKANPDTLKENVMSFVKDFANMGLLVLRRNKEKSDRRIYSGKEKIRLARNVSWNNENGEITILNNETGELMLIGRRPDWTLMWRLLDGKRTLQEILADISAPKVSETERGRITIEPLNLIPSTALLVLRLRALEKMGLIEIGDKNVE